MNVKKFIKHPLGIIAILLAVMALVILLGTPFILKRELNKWIVSQQGPDNVQTDNLDFNPFTGKLSLYNLQVETQLGQVLHITEAHLNFSWANLLKKRLYLNEVVLEDTYLLVDKRSDAGFRVAGLVLPDMAEKKEKKEPSDGWGVAINRFKIINSKIEYDTQEFAATYHIDLYELTDLKSWEEQQPISVELQGRIDDSPIHIDAQLTPFAQPSKFKGNLKLEQAELSLVSKILAIEQIAIEGKLDIDINMETVRQQDKLINFSTEGDISIGGLKLTYDDMTFMDEKVSWKGILSGNKPPVEGYTFGAEGNLSLQNLGALLPSEFMTVQTKDLQWQGSIDYTVQKGSQDIKAAANLTAAGFTVGDTARDVNLVDLQEIAVDTFDIKSLNDMSVDGITLQKVGLFSRGTLQTVEQEAAPNALLMADNVNIKNISYTDLTILAASDATLDSFQAYLRHQKGGGWYLLNPASSQGSLEAESQLSDEEPAQVAEQVEPSEEKQPVVDSEETSKEPKPADETGEPAMEVEPAAAPLHFRLGLLQVKNESSFQFEDLSTSRPFKLKLNIEEFQVTDIDSTDTAKPMQIVMKSTVENYSKINAEGSLQPFADPISTKMKGEIVAGRMPPLSSYSGKYMGYNITSGQLDAEINVNIDKGKLDGNADLHMRNINVAKVDPAKEPEIDAQMKRSLESDLNMLRDKNDVVNLNIILQGDITNPQFNFQDAINQAIAKAMTFATMSFVKYAIQPFGAVIAVAEIAGKKGMKGARIQLDPVQFGAAQISLDDNSKQYLEKVAVILKERPKVKLEVCGVAVEKDRTALLEQRRTVLQERSEKAAPQQKETIEVEPVADEVLEDFANERAKLVKSILVNEHGISHDRLYLCLPAIDEGPGKDPYVKLLID